MCIRDRKYTLEVEMEEEDFKELCNMIDEYGFATMMKANLKDTLLDIKAEIIQDEHILQKTKDELPSIYTKIINKSKNQRKNINKPFIIKDGMVYKNE